MAPPVVLFGYDSSVFTQKIRLALRLKQIQYTFIIVSSMMPRPVLRKNLQLTYRKIPVCLIGRDVYCDTSIILEALEHFFPSSQGYGSIYPQAKDGRTYRPLIRGFASYWTDRPLFRVTTGLIPSSVWRTRFGTDRAGLIGHKLDPNKLERKIPQNLSGLDLHLSILEPLFKDTDGPWIFSTNTPSLADIALFYQLEWGNNIAAGKGIKNLTEGESNDSSAQGATMVFNAQRYPNLMKWFDAFHLYLSRLPNVEIRAVDSPENALRATRDYVFAKEIALLPTSAPPHVELDAKNGLLLGAEVTVAPDDTGRDDPTFGTLIALTTEEIVIEPRKLEVKAPIDVRIHFPRLGFVVRPLRTEKL